MPSNTYYCCSASARCQNEGSTADTSRLPSNEIKSISTSICDQSPHAFRAHNPLQFQRIPFREYCFHRSLASFVPTFRASETQKPHNLGPEDWVLWNAVEDKP